MQRCRQDCHECRFQGIGSSRFAILDGNRWRLYAPPSFALPPIHHWRVLQDRKYSRILIEPAPGGRLAKMARPRSLPRDALRKYLRCQARREWQAAAILSDLGVRTPRVYAFGFTIAPHAAFESFVIMEYLDAHRSLRDMFRTLRDPRRRRHILLRVAEDLGTVFTNGYLHKDAHFENVLIDRGDRPVWIDNELRRRRRRQDLQMGLSKAVSLLRQSARTWVSDTEWLEFRRRLQETLDGAGSKRVMHA